MPQCRTCAMCVENVSPSGDCFACVGRWIATSKSALAALDRLCVLAGAEYAPILREAIAMHVLCSFLGRCRKPN